MRPLLSILIATKNRVPYCIQSVEAILSSLEGDQFEIIIQDNSDSFDLKEHYVKNLTDPRVKYNYTPPPLSAIDNFNKAVEASLGEYLILIGDDDAVCKQILDIAKWAEEHNFDSVCSRHFFEYIWPDTFFNNMDSTLKIPFVTSAIEKVETNLILSSFFKDGAVDYLKKGFPKLYHGLVRRSCMEKIRSITGHYFGGLSVDIYSAIALSCIVDSHYLIDIPFTIAGACKDSATTASVKGQHSGKLNEAPHFRDIERYEWDQMIPEIYSVETIWAETALKAITEMGRYELYQQFNKPLFIVKNILRNLNHFGYFVNQTFLFIKNSPKRLNLFLTVIYTLFATLLKAIHNRIRTNKNKDKYYITLRNVNTIGEATRFSNSKINEIDLITFLNRNV